MAMDTGHNGNGMHGQRGDGDAFQHAKVMVDEARAFGRSLSSSAQDFSEAVDLRGRVQRHPLGMVAAALGVGYLLGGGLFTPLTGRVLRVGMRLAILPLVKNQLAAMAGAAGSPDPRAAEGTPGAL